MKKDRKDFDERVIEYIKKNYPMTRAMNLERHLIFPGSLLDAWQLRSTSHSNQVRKMWIVDASLRRLKKTGKIECVKEGTPHWRVIP